MAEATTTAAMERRDASNAAARHVASGWYGVWWLVITEASLFAYLLFSYVYTMLQVGQNWPPDGAPSLTLALPNTFILLFSSGVIWLGERAGRRGHENVEVGLLICTIVLGIIFVSVQFVEWSHKSFTYSSDLYGSFYFTVTGFHMAHVIAGLIGLSALAVWLLFGRNDALGPTKRLHQRPVSIGSIYWHFVDVVWLFVFTTFYLAPYWR